MKRILTYAIPLTLSGCMNFSEVETQALYDRAIADSRKQPKSIHLAYLHCYALPDLDKDSCQRAIRKNIDGAKNASSWEYIRPFDHESERLGFVSFLRDRGKNCKAVNEGPKYNNQQKSYDVNCADNHHYKMRFDYENQKWKIMN